MVDNGEGENATGQDLVRVVPTNTEPVCIFTNTYPGKVTEGNIQVHKTIIKE